MMQLNNVAWLLWTISSSNGLPTTNNPDIIPGNNQFGIVLSTFLLEEPPHNLWISPISITSCFALVYPGSAGITRAEIQNIMRYPITSGPDEESVVVQFFNLQQSIESTFDGSKIGNYERSPKRTLIGIANKIFSANDLVLKQSYIDMLDNEGDSFIESDFNFAADDAKQIINDWVNENTNGLIQEIVDENMDISEWKLAALSAIFLEATFKKPFKPFMTSTASFYDSLHRENVVAECHLMHQIDDFDYFEDDNYQWIKFPFNDDADIFALFVLPKNPDIYSHSSGLITDWEVIDSAINNLESTYVALALPKLSVEASYQLKEPLVDLGLQQAFTSSADFSGISDDSLMIDSVIHKTMVEMDEDGLVAAAVTMIGMMRSSFRPSRAQPILFKADHSFQMFIIDGEHENAMLFMGQINNPGIPDGSDEPTFVESSDETWIDTRKWDPSTIGPSAESVPSESAPSGISGVEGAFCILYPDGGSGVSGRVLFESQGNSTKITARVTGLTPGQHGFHIHEMGDLSGGCKSAKGHFNPFSKNHGGPKDVIRHIGDLGNIIANAHGVATFEMVDPLLQLNGEHSIIGRSVVVHAGADDLGIGGFEDSSTTGHAGSRLACGVIGIGNPIWLQLEVADVDSTQGNGWLGRVWEQFKWLIVVIMVLLLVFCICIMPRIMVHFCNQRARQQEEQAQISRTDPRNVVDEMCPNHIDAIRLAQNEQIVQSGTASSDNMEMREVPYGPELGVSEVDGISYWDIDREQQIVDEMNRIVRM